MASQEQSVEQLFGAALDHRPEDRRAFLDRACASAPELRQRVEELLLADEQAGNFLEQPFLVSLADRWDDTVPVEETSGARASIGFKSASVGRFDPGQTIADRFTVVRFIAHGGMGEVYEVEDRFLQGVHVALKVILPHIAGDAGSSRRFEQEVLLARKVTHPNLCPIYDISRCQEPAPPFLFLTMKLLSGETLASRLKRPSSIPRNESISIFRQMTAGLAAIHDGGIVHRDIKPNNVMLDYSGSELCLSIMDFGLARLYDSQTTVTIGLIAGTPGYIAPELLRGDPPSQATDIFALGVLFQQVLTNRCLDDELHGLSAKPSPALDAADVPPLYIHSVKEFLSEDPDRRCVAFQQMRSAFDSGGAISARTSIDSLNNPPSRNLTRRNFVIGSALTTCAAAGGIAWKWDGVKDTFDDLIHPLPLKRFVALIDWPVPSDARMKPMLVGVIDAIASELSRAEAFDHNLFVIAQKTITDITTPAQMNELRESLGANLVLAASGTPMTKELHLRLSVLDPSANRQLREREIRVPLDQQTSLPDKAVRAAAKLLDISHHQANESRRKAGTDNLEAFAAFQAGDALLKQPNDKGLEAAIEKYKEAIDLDPHYAMPNARLAWAYCRFYAIHRNPSALLLAKDNCTTALALDSQLPEGYLALASVLEYTGDKQGALRETAKALACDPSDPAILVYQAQLYSRSNRWAEAEATFERVLKLRPNYAWAHNELGVLYNSQGKYPEALTEFRAVTLETPKDALAFSNVGSVYLQQGKIADALENLGKSMALSPSDAAASTMAATLRAQGKYITAVAFAKKAVDLDADESLNWLELADCYSLLPNHQADAKDAYLKGAVVEEQALNTNPDDGPGWIILALTRIKSGSPQTAPLLLEKAERQHSDDIDSQLYKARILELLGKRDGALSTIARCLAKGATVSQIRFMPDMELLRKDPRYEAMASANFSTTQINL
jgi:eukaryotic-like serine/threonine-protein kinase